MDKKQAKWIVKTMRKKYKHCGDQCVLDIAKNSYHDNMISWEDLKIIADIIHYEFYDWFERLPDEERRSQCKSKTDNSDRIDAYIKKYEKWQAMSFFKKVVIWIKYHPISSFKKFMLNPSWADEYNAAPPKVKAYYKLIWNYNDSKYRPKKRLKKMEDNFEISDWEYLLSKSHSFQWYDYKKKMVARFPDYVFPPKKYEKITTKNAIEKQE